MIKFEKIPFEDYYNYYLDQQEKDAKQGNCYDIDRDEIYKEWEDIKLPKRSTSGSAGYDFYTPVDLGFSRYDKRYKLIPTGIRFITDRDDIFLLCVPRSGLGFKYQLHLANTAGIIDLDYEKHILAKVATYEDCAILKGNAFMQGIIVPFCKTDDDDSTDTRNGGFGSTDRR